MARNNHRFQQHGEPRATALYESSNILNVSKEGRIASIVAGALLTTAGINRVDKHPVSSLFRLIAGGYLLYRGISGNCPLSAMIKKRTRDRHSSSINIRTQLMINRPRAEVYNSWRQLGNLPLFMKHLSKVEELDERRSHWIANGPGGVGTIEWDAEIVKEEPEKLLGWRSAPGSEIVTAGKVSFADTPGGGTEVQVMITYRPPAGHVGTGLAWLLNSAFEHIVEKDVRQFKQFMETREVTI